MRLVGLAITRAIVLLTDTNDDVRRGTGDPRFEARGDVLWLERKLGHGSPRVLLRDDYEPQPLTVSGARDLAAAGDDALQRLPRNGIRQEAPYRLATA